jgi:hypothetical protein
MVVGSMEWWSGMDFEHITQSCFQIVIALGGDLVQAKAWVLDFLLI